jgi:uncharacterized protein GlcG (DUF336 family)
MRRLVIVLITLVILGGAVPAHTEAPAASLSTADLQKVLMAAIAKAQELGIPMGISIVDAGGNLVAYIKMDGAFIHTNHTSFSKAYTSASIRKPSGSSGIPPNITSEISSTTGGKFTTLPGGLPILRDGKVIGAIGVGGGKGEQDEAVAKAGADALLSK